MIVKVKYWPWHVGGWLIYWLVVSMVWLDYGVTYGGGLYKEGIRLLPKLAVVYINLWILLPRFLYAKHYLRYVLSVVGIIAGGLLIQLGLIHFFDQESQRILGRTVDASSIVRGMMIINSVVIFTSALAILQKRMEDVRKVEQLEKEKSQAELHLLKSQVNPHFLFNTLNNLYSLAVRQSPETPEVIARLSQLMRYMLKQSDASEVPLSKEINFLKSYLLLEKLRYDDSLKVRFDITGEVTNQQVAPMLFIPLVENAFKHGLSDKSSKEWLNIQMVLEDSQLRFAVENSIPETPNLINAEDGTGLTNLRTRLNLLYPQAHELTLKPQSNCYSAELKINLT